MRDRRLIPKRLAVGGLTGLALVTIGVLIGGTAGFAGSRAVARDITACVNQSGYLQFPRSGGDCPGAAVSWGEVGPVGPQGPGGPAGPAGKPNPKALALKLSALKVRQQRSLLVRDANIWNKAYIRLGCEKGYRPVGGGGGDVRRQLPVSYTQSAIVTRVGLNPSTGEWELVATSDKTFQLYESPIYTKGTTRFGADIFVVCTRVVP